MNPLNEANADSYRDYDNLCGTASTRSYLRGTAAAGCSYSTSDIAAPDPTKMAIDDGTRMSVELVSMNNERFTESILPV